MKKQVIYIYARNMHLGDTIALEPIVRQLLESGKHVVIWTKYPAIFKDYPYKGLKAIGQMSLLHRRYVKLLHWVNKFLIKQIHVKGLPNFYDMNLLDFHALEVDNVKKGLEAENMVKWIAQYFGLPYIVRSPVFFFLNQGNYVNPYPPKKYVILHIKELNEQLPFKHIYGVNWEKIIRQLNQENYEVFQLIEHAHSKIIAGAQPLKKQLDDLIVYMHYASFFIGSDSGPSHIAKTTQTPAIIFFGAINPAYIQNNSLFKGIVLQNPCTKPFCYHIQNNGNDAQCLLKNTSEELSCCTFTDKQVLDAIEEIKKIDGQS
ncbi:MAG: glycosyltransferase family 9 protein [Phycisphaerales bacterium]|nr:glycosyltransferase family 9 protein [Phycisphaerales bacterium]